MKICEIFVMGRIAHTAFPFKCFLLESN